MFLIRKITFFLSLLLQCLKYSLEETAQESTPAILMESQNKSSIQEMASNSTATTLISNSNSTDTSLITSEYTTARSESNGNVTVFSPASGNNSETVIINQTSSSPAMNGTSEKPAVTEVTAGSTNSTMVLNPEAVLDQESTTRVSSSAIETKTNSSSPLLSSGTTKSNSSTGPSHDSRTMPVSTPEMTQLSSDEGGCPCTVTTLSPTSPDSPGLPGDTPMSAAPVADMASATPSPKMCSCPPSQETSDGVSGSSTTTTASPSESTAPVIMATSANLMDSSIVAEPEHTNLSADPVQSATPVNVVEVVTQKQAGFLPAPISVTLKVK